MLVEKALFSIPDSETPEQSALGAWLPPGPWIFHIRARAGKEIADTLNKCVPHPSHGQRIRAPSPSSQHVVDPLQTPHSPSPVICGALGPDSEFSTAPLDELEPKVKF